MENRINLTELDPEYLSGIFSHRPELIGTIIDYLEKDTLFNPILSLGSGHGYLEYFINKWHINKPDIICIDPNPDSFSKKDPIKSIMPSYKFAYDVDKNYINNNTLLIIWPNQENSKTSINGDYDYDAIILLKPKILLISYGPCGASGSDKLIDLLGSRKNTDFIQLFTKPPSAAKNINIEDIQYDLIYCNDLIIGTGYGFSGKTLRLVIYVQHNYISNFNIKDIINPIILENKLENLNCSIS